MRDRVCLAFALTTGAELNFGAIFKLTMRKAQVYHRRRYVFGGLITELYSRASVPTKDLDYFPRIVASPYNVTNIKGPEKSTGPVLTIAERNHRDELIMGCMLRLKMLHHRIGECPSTQQELY